MLPTALLDLVGEFSGLILQDDRRFKKATLRVIRIRCSGQKLRDWSEIDFIQLGKIWYREYARNYIPHNTNEG